MAPLLEVASLAICFGATEAVHGISFSLDKGELLGMVAESGSGKSATAHAFCRRPCPRYARIGRCRWPQLAEDSKRRSRRG